MYETKPYFYGTGRRKDSVARVRVYTGTGKVTINDRDIDNYFGLETLKLIVRSPLVLLGLEGKYDVVVRVSGGGVSGQAGAIRHGLARALLQQNEENRSVLKKAGFLTRDPRMKERKKYGLNGCTSRTSVLQALIYCSYSIKMLQNPGRLRFSGVFLCPKFCQDCSVLMEFERKFMGLCCSVCRTHGTIRYGDYPRLRRMV